MAKTRLQDDDAAVVLLAGIVKQARKDITRRAVAPMYRVSAIELFMEIDGHDDANLSSEDCPAARAATGRGCTGAAAARGVPAPVGTRRVRRC